MNKPFTIKIGKYTCKVTEQNEPSEEAILRFRKVLTRIMDEYYESHELNETNENKEE